MPRKSPPSSLNYAPLYQRAKDNYPIRLTLKERYKLSETTLWATPVVVALVWLVALKLAGVHYLSWFALSGWLIMTILALVLLVRRDGAHEKEERRFEANVFWFFTQNHIGSQGSLPLELAEAQCNETFGASLFRLGHDKVFARFITPNSQQPGSFVGLYNYTIGQKTTASYDSGVMVMRFPLSCNVPHVIVKPVKKYRSLSLEFSAKKYQKLTLEGDFPKYFAVYAPAKYERDATYMLTPSLMALLVDHAPGMYVETVDNWVYVYGSSEQFPFRRPEHVEKIFRLYTILAKTLPSIARRYKDDRIPRADYSGEVREEGRRLRITKHDVFITVGLVIVFAIFKYGVMREVIRWLFST